MNNQRGAKIYKLDSHRDIIFPPQEKDFNSTTREA